MDIKQKEWKMGREELVKHRKTKFMLTDAQAERFAELMLANLEDLPEDLWASVREYSRGYKQNVIAEWVKQKIQANSPDS